jgi:hypothetical protein
MGVVSVTGAWYGGLGIGCNEPHVAINDMTSNTCVNAVVFEVATIPCEGEISCSFQVSDALFPSGCDSGTGCPNPCTDALYVEWKCGRF